MIAGLPVFSRFALSRNCQNSILVAALLNQPIIPRAHHEALADGYQLLNDVASFVNSLGDVTWTDLRNISRSSYAHIEDGNILSVKMLTRRITVRVPQQTTQIRVERPWLDAIAPDQLLWRTSGGDPHWNLAAGQEFIPVEPGVILEVASRPGKQTPMETSVHGGSRRLFPIARRILTETRDRSLPLIHRVVRRLRSRT